MVDQITPKLLVVRKLAKIIAALMLLQSLSGLLVRDVYRDNLFVRSAWLGNDWVTLLLAFPILVISLRPTQHSLFRSTLILLGILAYCFYNYAFYLFGAALNSLFLVFVLLWGISFYALVIGFIALSEIKPTAARTGASTSWVAGYMLLWALFLSALWIFQSLNFVFTGTIPAIVLATGHPTNITGALDLSLMIPPVFLSALWLWRGNPWGMVLGIIMNIKGALYALVLAAGSFCAAKNGIPGIAQQIPLWIALALASAACLYALFKKMDPAYSSQLNRQSGQWQNPSR